MTRGIMPRASCRVSLKYKVQARRTLYLYRILSIAGLPVPHENTLMIFFTNNKFGVQATVLTVPTDVELP